MPITQQNRPISATTPLGEDVLLLRSMTGSEQLGGLFEYQLELLSEKVDIGAEQLLGQPITVTLKLLEEGERHFHGLVSRLSHLGFDGAFALYGVTVVPWLWFLTRTSDCRIFQEKTVPEIIKEVFRDQGFTDFEDRLSGDYRQWPYCVQYRETDFNFVSRLMEQEGIYYYFRHENGKHTLILSDSYSSHESVPGFEQISFHPPDETSLAGDHISDWSISQTVQPGVYAHRDFDFEAPRKDLLAKRSHPKSHQAADHEIFDFPGEYTDRGHGENYARLRLEELQAGFETATAESSARGLTCGALFSLTDYPREDQNREYLILSADYRLQSDVLASSGSTSGAPVFQSSLVVADAQTPYRPARNTPKPIVQGPQTAIVVGKAGEEIWTDEYGRVKVQFHWDRYGKSDENSSCWIRVSSPWAGKNWGGIHIPRIGQEVIVEFLEGDPDRPIITGRVYNGDNMPPYGLPENMTQSGLKSRSTKGGSGSDFNELRFEDKKGAEEVYLHAERMLRTIVEASESRSVGYNRSTTIGNDESLTVKQNRDVRIQEGDQHVIVEKGDHSMDVDTGNYTLTVKTGDQAVKVESGMATLDVDSSSREVNVPSGAYDLKAKEIQLTASSSIELLCGGGSIKMTADGKIAINGVNLESIASAINDIKGATVKINT